MAERVEHKAPQNPDVAIPNLTLGQILGIASSFGVLNNLSPREQLVVVQHWQNQFTLEQIAEQIGGVTRERVRRIENRAWRKILKHLEPLRPLIEEQLKKRHEMAMQTPEYRDKRRQLTLEHWQDPDYRARITGPETRQIRSLAMKKKWQDPDYRDRMLQVLQSPHRREMSRQRTINLWQDPDYRDRVINSLQKPEAREKRSQSARERWQDPNLRQRVSEAQLKKWQEPGYREKMSQLRKELFRNSEHRERAIQNLRRIPITPEARQKASEKITLMWQDPTYRAQRSQATREQMIERWKDPEYRRRMSPRFSEGQKRRQERERAARAMHQPAA